MQFGTQNGRSPFDFVLLRSLERDPCYIQWERCPPLVRQWLVLPLFLLLITILANSLRIQRSYFKETIFRRQSGSEEGQVPRNYSIALLENSLFLIIGLLNIRGFQIGLCSYLHGAFKQHFLRIVEGEYFGSDLFNYC